MQKLLENLLSSLSRSILEKYQPEVIAVSGSIGKTSAKEAIFAVLQNGTSVRRSPKSYNNRLGVPLTVIGSYAVGKDVFGWIGAIMKALRLIVLRDSSYPKTLVIELGGDKKGDIEELMKLAEPSSGVLTAIAPTHTEFYGSVEAIAEEEGKVLTMLPENGTAVVNIDSPHAYEARNKTKAKLLTYGMDARADIRAVTVNSFLYWNDLEMKKEHAGGLLMRVRSRDEEAEVELDGVFGEHSAYAPLAALAVATSRGMSLADAARELGGYRAPPGRMRLIPGVKATVLIDDTYNSSPEAAVAALHTLAQLPLKGEMNRRIAVLGDMAELGTLSEASHRDVGAKAKALGIDLLVCVGEKSRDTARGAKEAGMDPLRVVEFAKSDEAGRYVQDQLKPGDVVLVKGSQSSRLERVVKELMAEPQRAEELLVRNDAAWLAIE